MGKPMFKCNSSSCGKTYDNLKYKIYTDEFGDRTYEVFNRCECGGKIEKIPLPKTDIILCE